MIENFSDFLSIFALADIIFYALYLLMRSLAKKQKRKVIEREIEYYREIY